MIIAKTGDIFSTNSGAIGHGTNVYGLMGKGIAVEFKNRFPEMHAEYVRRCELNMYEPGDAMIWHQNKNRYIFNLFSQDKPGPNARYSWAYKSIGLALDFLSDYTEVTSLAIPRIGCGIGGLDWPQMQYELTDRFSSHVTDLEIWSL